MDQDKPRRIIAIILIVILAAAIFAASCHKISYLLLGKAKGFAENALEKLWRIEPFVGCLIVGIILAILAQEPYPIAIVVLPAILIVLAAALWVLSAPFLYMEKVYLVSAAVGGGIGWLMGRGIYRPLANRWRGKWLAKLVFFSCYFIVLAVFIRSIIIYPQEKVVNEGMEFFVGESMDEPLERVERLWKKMFIPLINWTEEDIIKGKWSVYPPYASKTVNGLANFFYKTGKGIALGIAIVVSYCCVFAVVATISLLYLILCFSLLIAYFLSYPVYRLVLVSAEGSVWAINDLFKKSITYEIENLQYYSYVSVLSVIYAFVPALYLRLIVLNILWYFIIFPIIYLISIIHYRHLAFPNLEGIKIMKNDKQNKEDKEIKDFSEVEIPDVVSTQPDNYLEYLAVKRGLKRVGKTIGTQKKVLEQIHEYFTTATAARKSKFEYENLEDEQEITKTELETRKIEALNRQKLASGGYSVEQEEREARELEAKARKLKAIAEIEALQKDDNKDELDDWLKEAEQVDAKEEWFDMKVQQIREKYRDDPARAEERIGNLDRRLTEMRFWEGSDRNARRRK